MDTPTQEPASLPTLPELAEASRAHRLSPADEERATTLLKELLGGGKAGIVSALEPMLLLPWIVCVNAVSAIWPGWTLPMKRHFLSTLAKSDTEQARRLRLSVARAVFKLEPAAGLKIAAATAADLKDAETGALSAKHRQMFFHVFIGKGKPWLLQLSLADLKGADADSLVHAAIESFPLCPPLSQLSILRWVYGGGRFKKISESDLAVVVKSVGRWNARLQQQLKAEVAELPEAIVTVLKPEPPKVEEIERKERPREATPAPTEPEIQSAPEEVEAASTEGEPAVQPAVQPSDAVAPPAAPAAPEVITIPKRDRGSRRDERPERPAREAQPPREAREAREAREPRERESRESREAREPEKGRKPFDFKDSLRGLESYVQGLRNELEQTRTQLRRREEELKRGRLGRPEREERRPTADAETLARHNAQLEATVTDLRQQLEDLASYHEAVAESRRLHGEEPLPEGSAESLKALLAIKLKESYEAYTAMRLEPLDRVFRLDYRDLLGSVFDVLLHEGVKLEGKE